MADYDVNVRITPDERGAERVKSSMRGIDDSAKRAREQVEGVGRATQGMGGQSAAASREMDRMAMSMGSASQKATGLNKAMRVLSGYISAFAAYAFISSTVRGFQEWELALTNVEKTTNMTREEVRKLGGELLKIARVAPLSATGLAAIATAAGQLGVRGVEDLTKMSKVVADLTIATNLYEEEAAFALKQTLDLTGRGVEETENLASVWVRLGNNFAVTERQISSFSREIAKSTTIFGFNPEDVGALSAAAGVSGISPQVAGTSILRVMSTMNEAMTGNMDIMNEWLRVMGISEERFRELWEQEGAASMDLFVKAIQGFNRLGKDAPASLDRLGLSSVRVTQTVQGLGKVLHKTLLPAMRDARKEMAEGNALTQETEKFYNILQSRLKKLSQTYEEAFNVFGEQFKPLLSDFAMQDQKFIADLIDTGTIENWARNIAGALQFVYDNLQRVWAGIAVVLGNMAGKALWGQFQSLLGWIKEFLSGGLVGMISDTASGLASLAGGLTKVAAGLVAWEGITQVMSYMREMGDIRRGDKALAELREARETIFELNNVEGTLTNSQNAALRHAKNIVSDPDRLRESLLSTGLDFEDDPWKVYWDRFLMNAKKAVTEAGIFLTSVIDGIAKALDFSFLKNGMAKAMIDAVEIFLRSLWDGLKNLWGNMGKFVDMWGMENAIETLRSDSEHPGSVLTTKMRHGGLSGLMMSNEELASQLEARTENLRSELGDDPISRLLLGMKDGLKEGGNIFRVELPEIFKGAVEAAKEGMKEWENTFKLSNETDRARMALEAGARLPEPPGLWEGHTKVGGGKGFWSPLRRGGRIIQDSEGHLDPTLFKQELRPDKYRRFSPADTSQSVHFGDNNPNPLERTGNLAFDWWDKYGDQGYGFQPDATGKKGGFFDDMLTGTGDWKKAWEDAASTISGSMENLFVNDIPGYMGHSVVEVLRGTQSMGDAFRGLANLIAETVIRTLVEVAVKAAVLQAIGFAFGSSPTFGTSSKHVGPTNVSADFKSGFQAHAPVLSHSDSVKSFTLPGGATGGLMKGSGGPTQDNLPALLSNGEFVTNAANSERFMPLLDAINNYKPGSGGGSSGGGGGRGETKIVVEDHRPKGSPNIEVEAMQGLSPLGVMQTRLLIKEERANALRTGEADNTYRQAYGARRQPVKR